MNIRQFVSSLIIVMFSPTLYALTCSSLEDKYSINEIKTNGGGNSLRIIEIKTLADNLDINGFQLCYWRQGSPDCVDIGQGNGQWNGTGNLDNAGPNAPANPTTFSENTWLTYDYGNINSNEGEVILFDASGDVIDYLCWDKNSDCNLGSTYYSVPLSCGTYLNNTDPSNKNFSRSPDGTGDWGNTGSTTTIGSSNDGGSGGGGGGAVSCNDVFADGVGAVGSGNKIDLNYNTAIHNSPDNIINTSEFTSSSGSSVPSCSTTNCTSSNSSGTELTLPGFETHSGNKTQNVGWQSSYTFDGSKTDYKSVSTSSEATVTFETPPGGEYRIEDVDMGYKSTLNLYPGDYYIENFNSGSLFTLNVLGTGTVRLYIRYDWSIGDASFINSPTPLGSGPGDASKLVLFGYDQISFDDSVAFTGYIYSTGKVDINSASQLYGGIVANKLVANSYVDIYFTDIANNDVDMGQSCETNPDSSGGLVDTYTYWTLDEIINDELPDESYNNLPATLLGNATIDDNGYICKAVSVPNNTTDIDGISSTINPNPILTPQGSISFWFNSNNDWDAFSGERILFDASTATDESWGAIDSDGRLVFRFDDDDGDTFKFRSPTNNISANTWTHIIYTWNFTTGDLFVYVDGVSQTLSKVPGFDNLNKYDNMPTLSPLTFGDSNGLHASTPNQSSNGLIDELILHDFALEAANAIVVKDFTHDCPSDPIAYYDFDEPSGYSGGSYEILDSTGNNLHLDDKNSSFDQDLGYLCKGGSFNGTDSFLWREYNATYDDFSAGAGGTFWMKVEEYPASGSYDYIFSKSYHFSLRIEDDGRLWFRWLNDSGTGYNTYTTNPIPLNTWTHIGFSLADNVHQLYVDGVLDIDDSQSTGFRGIYSGGFKIGANNDTPNNRNFDGMLDEFRLYASNISQSDILRDMAYESVCSSSISAQYDFDEFTWNGSSSEVKDSASNNNGQSINGPFTNNELPALGDSTAGTCFYGNFDRTENQKITIPYDEKLNPTGSYSISLWAKVDGYNGQWRSPITSRSEENSANIRKGFMIYAGTNNRWQFWQGTGTDSWDTVTGLSVTSDWTHIVATFDALSENNGIYTGTQTLYVNGSPSVSNNQLYAANVLSDLSIGAGGNSGNNYYWNGQIDEVQIYDGALTQAEVDQLALATRSCSAVPALTTLEIIVNSTASTCSPHSVTINAKDASGDLVSNFNGTVNLTTTSGHGNWAKANANANGTLNPSVDNDNNGAATYQFSVSDQGSASFTLSNETKDQLNINAQNGGISAQSGLITFSDLLFEYTIDPVQVAGKPLSISAQLTKSDASTGACGVATDFNEDVPLFYSSHADFNSANAPMIGSTRIPTSSGSLAITFNNGIASFNVNSDDVGEFTLGFEDTSGYAQDENNNPIAITGNSNTISLPPFGFDVSVPGKTRSEILSTNGSGDAIAKAGNDISIKVTAKLWQASDDDNSDGIPNSNADLSDNNSANNFNLSGESISLSQSLNQPSLVDGGSAGSLTGQTTLNSFDSNGSQTVTVQYDEVGTINLTAALTDGDYRGSGNNISSTLQGFGRFSPHRFTAVLNTPALTPSPAAYLGQTLSFATPPSLTLQAVNKAGLPVNNYGKDWWKLNSVPNTHQFIKGAGATTSGGAVNRVGASSSVSVDDGNNFTGSGTIEFSDNQVIWNRSGTEPGANDVTFNAALSLELAANALVDSDGVCFDSNNDGTCDAFSSADFLGPQLHFGIIRLGNTIGGELTDLTMPVSINTWQLIDGVYQFAPFNQDNSTSLSLTDFNYNNCVNATSVSNFCANQATWQPSNWPGFTNGVGPLTFNSPGDNNQGAVEVSLNTPAWLELDGEDANGFISFGVNEGKNPVIYLREQFR